MNDEPCTNCGAPMDAVQRYCLNCGTRRGGPCVEADVAPTAVAAGAGGAAPAPAPPEGLDGWLRANTATLGLGGLLLATLLVGLLVGHWATSSSAPATQAQAPQIIHVAGAAATTTTPVATAAATPTAKTKKKKARTKARTATAKTTTKAVDAASLDGKALEKAIKKKEPISTGSGPLPKTDDKPAGGGTGFDTIG